MVNVGDTVQRQEFGMTITGVVGHVTPAPAGAVDYLYTAENGYLGRSDTVTVVKRAPEPEPTGLGAVARDQYGVLWVRAETDPLDWRSVQGEWSDWWGLDEPTVLSPGWAEE